MRSDKLTEARMKRAHKNATDAELDVLKTLWELLKTGLNYV